MRGAPQEICGRLALLSDVQTRLCMRTESHAERSRLLTRLPSLPEETRLGPCTESHAEETGTATCLLPQESYAGDASRTFLVSQKPRSHRRCPSRGYHPHRIPKAHGSSEGCLDVPCLCSEPLADFVDRHSFDLYDA